MHFCYTIIQNVAIKCCFFTLSGIKQYFCSRFQK